RGCHAGCSSSAIRTSQSKRTSSSFASSNARLETNAATNSNVPRPLRSGGGRQGTCQPPNDGKGKVSVGLSRSLLFGRRPATSLRTKTNMVEDSFGQPVRCRKTNHHSATGCLLYFFYFLQGKNDEENKKNRAGSQQVVVSVGWYSLAAASGSRAGSV